MPKTKNRDFTALLREKGFERAVIEWIGHMNEVIQGYNRDLDACMRACNQIIATTTAMMSAMDGMDHKLKELTRDKPYKDDGEGGIVV